MLPVLGHVKKISNHLKSEENVLIEINSLSVFLLFYIFKYQNVLGNSAVA